MKDERTDRTTGERASEWADGRICFGWWRRIQEDFGAQIEIQNYPECNLLKWVFNILCRRRAKNMEFYIQNSIKFPISRKSYPDDDDEGRWRWSSGQMVIGLVQCIAQWLTTRHASAPLVFSLHAIWIQTSRPYVVLLDLSLHCDRFEWPAVVVGEEGEEVEVEGTKTSSEINGWPDSKYPSSGMRQSEEELFAIGKWFAHFALYKLLPLSSSSPSSFPFFSCQTSDDRPGDSTTVRGPPCWMEIVKSSSSNPSDNDIIFANSHWIGIDWLIRLSIRPSIHPSNHRVVSVAIKFNSIRVDVAGNLLVELFYQRTALIMSTSSFHQDNLWTSNKTRSRVW